MFYSKLFFVYICISVAKLHTAADKQSLFETVPTCDQQSTLLGYETINEQQRRLSTNSLQCELTGNTEEHGVNSRNRQQQQQQSQLLNSTQWKHDLALELIILRNTFISNANAFVATRFRPVDLLSSPIDVSSPQFCDGQHANISSISCYYFTLCAKLCQPGISGNEADGTNSCNYHTTTTTTVSASSLYLPAVSSEVRFDRQEPTSCSAVINNYYSVLAHDNRSATCGLNATELGNIESKSSAIQDVIGKVCDMREWYWRMKREGVLLGNHKAVMDPEHTVSIEKLLNKRNTSGVYHVTCDLLSLYERLFMKLEKENNETPAKLFPPKNVDNSSNSLKVPDHSLGPNCDLESIVNNYNTRHSMDSGFPILIPSTNDVHADVNTTSTHIFAFVNTQSAPDSCSDSSASDIVDSDAAAVIAAESDFSDNRATEITIDEAPATNDISRAIDSQDTEYDTEHVNTERYVQSEVVQADVDESAENIEDDSEAGSKVSSQQTSTSTWLHSDECSAPTADLTPVCSLVPEERNASVQRNEVIPNETTNDTEQQEFYTPSIADDEEETRKLIAESQNDVDYADCQGVRADEYQALEDAQISDEMHLKQNSAADVDKLKSMELQILRLENQLLQAAMARSSDLSTAFQLENHILKLENDVLRLSQRFQTRVKESEMCTSVSTVGEQRELAELVLFTQNHSKLIHDLQVRYSRMEQYNGVLLERIVDQSLRTNQLMLHMETMAGEQRRLNVELMEIKRREDQEKWRMAAANTYETANKATRIEMFPVTPMYSRNGYQGGTDCYDLYSRGEHQDGIYRIYPAPSSSHSTEISASCDMIGGGWTLLQRRLDGSVDFYRTWQEYKHGFGDFNGEFWIGNDVIHLLTNQDHYALRVELTDWNRITHTVDYEQFRITNESDGYRLYVAGYHATDAAGRDEAGGRRESEKAADAGDSLLKHSGCRFSTRDVDNDLVDRDFEHGSCSRRFGGAWWYYRCYMSNLNGRYYVDGRVPDGLYDGMAWKSWNGSGYSLKRVTLKIRPKSASTRG